MKDSLIVLYGAGEQNCGNAYNFIYSAGLDVEFICADLKKCRTNHNFQETFQHCQKRWKSD
ncbi:MAG: hypothetical protein Ta2B_17340 [Termitinemataceae bacterium]|nr:MAG: hypothetical protein Ta2B_17340 [Termitinemataceae bacterium]